MYIIILLWPLVSYYLYIYIYCIFTPSTSLALQDKEMLKDDCPHVLIGTPGRVLALCRYKDLKLDIPPAERACLQTEGAHPQTGRGRWRMGVWGGVGYVYITTI